MNCSAATGMDRLIIIQMGKPHKATSMGPLSLKFPEVSWSSPENTHVKDLKDQGIHLLPCFIVKKLNSIQVCRMLYRTEDNCLDQPATIPLIERPEKVSDLVGGMKRGCRKFDKRSAIMLVTRNWHSITLTAAFGTINYIPILTKRNCNDELWGL